MEDEQKKRTVSPEVRRRLRARWRPLGFEWEHIIPLSQGGTDTLENLALVSAQENRLKADALARDPRLPPDVQRNMHDLVADMKRTADAVTELVQIARSPIDRRIAVIGVAVAVIFGVAGVAIGIWIR